MQEEHSLPQQSNLGATQMTLTHQHGIVVYNNILPETRQFIYHCLTQAASKSPQEYYQDILFEKFIERI